jgi:hypothetical protein
MAARHAPLFFDPSIERITGSAQTFAASRVAGSSTLRFARRKHELDANGEHEAQIFLSIQHFFCTNTCKHFFVLLYSFSFGA